MVPNMELVKSVCEEAGFGFAHVGSHPNMAEVNCGVGKKYVFAYAATPFNREDVQRVCGDKFLTYSMLHEYVAMPKSRQYLRPDIDPELHGEIAFDSKEKILKDILDNFSLPCIVKMNAGSMGRNVVVCENVGCIKKAIDKIFEEDWALVAQEKIERKEELRVMIINGEVALAYRKGGKRFLEEDGEEFLELKGFLSPVSKNIDLNWGGLDVIRDPNGKLWLLEINTKPSFEAAVKNGQQEKIKPLYKMAFDKFLN
jgi:glutathione synthase/RimK-type ligase-like ATP-grasp enzyme